MHKYGNMHMKDINLIPNESLCISLLQWKQAKNLFNILNQLTREMKVQAALILLFLKKTSGGVSNL